MDYFSVGVLILAGGDASRLGLPKPKGMFNPGIEGVSSIFELINLKIKKLNELCEKVYPDSPDLGRQKIVLVIMTNILSYNTIKDYFKENDYFGYKTMIFFPQSHLPVTGEDGKLLLKAPNQILFAPNGNGSFFQSKNFEDVFSTLKKVGVEYLQITGVDNILNKFGDPSQLGLLNDPSKKVVSKYSYKKHALERVGVFAYANSRPAVIEYTLIGEERAKKTNEKGELLFNHSNLLNFMIKVSFLDNFIKNESHILDQRYNVAVKNIKHFDLEAKDIQETKALKFEIFIQEFLYFCEPEEFVLFKANRDFVS